MSWLVAIVVALALANVAVALLGARRSPNRAWSEEERLRRAIARMRAEERSRET